MENTNQNWCGWFPAASLSSPNEQKSFQIHRVEIPLPLRSTSTWQNLQKPQKQKQCENRNIRSHRGVWEDFTPKRHSKGNVYSLVSLRNNWSCSTRMRQPTERTKLDSYVNFKKRQWQGCLGGPLHSSSEAWQSWCEKRIVREVTTLVGWWLQGSLQSKNTPQ